MRDLLRIFKAIAGPVILLSFLIVLALQTIAVLLPVIEVWALAQ